MQMNLHHDSINDALRETVQAVGGYKHVGALMFPDESIEHAAAKVRDALNLDRRERFTPSQVLMICKLGRAIGCHAYMTFMAREAAYADPVPIAPEDEVARLQREFVEATKALGQMAARIEQVNASTMRRVA